MRDLTCELLTMPLRLAQWGIQGLDSNGPGGRAGLARGIWLWTTSTLTGDAPSPSRALRSMSQVLLRSPELLRLVVPGRESGVAWTEFRNKVEAFGRFATADAIFASPGCDRIDLLTAVRRAMAMTPYAGLWTAEGIGYYYAAAALQDDATPDGLLAGGPADRLPEQSLVPLHTGMGLAIAIARLSEFGALRSPGDVRRMLEPYLSCCRANSRPGYAGAVVEALGLIARVVRPRLVGPLDLELRRMEPELIGHFWHGVGRGLYFSPSNALPGGNIIWSSLGRAHSEPLHHLARVNAVAGFSWAVTLINIRDPVVLEWLLRRHGDEQLEVEAFANGARSAAMIWHDWAPRTPYLERLCRYRPQPADSTFLGNWDEAARSHCDEGFVRHYEGLRREARLGELFEFRP